MKNDMIERRSADARPGASLNTEPFRTLLYGRQLIYDIY